MKNTRFVLLLILLGAIGDLFSQNIGINEDGSTPEASAILDIKSTDKGLLIPRLTTGQRQGISSPAEGLMVFDVDTRSIWTYSASSWTEVGSDDEDWTSTATDIYTLGKRVGIGRSDLDPYQFRSTREFSTPTRFYTLDIGPTNSSLPMMDLAVNPNAGGVGLRVLDDGAYNLADHTAIEGLYRSYLTGRLGHYDSDSDELIAVLGEVNVGFSNSYAGVFRGKVKIGESNTTDYILPDSRGSAGQVMYSDGAGAVTWETLVVDDADADPSNEIQTLSKSGNIVSLSDGGGSFIDEVDDGDSNPFNEIQDLSLSGTILSLSDDLTSVDLGPLVSDDGDWSANGTHIYNANTGNVGIGVSSPQNKLHLERADQGQLAIQFAGKEVLTFTSSRNSNNNTGASTGGSAADSWSGSVNAAAAAGGNYWTGGEVGDGERSDYLDITFTSFNSSIPTDATILGVRVNIRKRASDSSDIEDYLIQLRRNGVATGQNKAVSTPWPTSFSYNSYGGATDLWGVSGITPAVINGGGLGVRIQYEGDIGLWASDEQGFVDYVYAQVYYETPGSEVDVDWVAGTMDGEFAIDKGTSLTGSTFLKIDGTGVTELQGLRLTSGASTGRVLTSLADGEATWQDLPADGDSDSTNELQDLTLSGTVLSLSGDATTVDLSGILDDGDWTMGASSMSSGSPQVLIGGAAEVTGQGLGVLGDIGVTSTQGATLNMVSHSTLGTAASQVDLFRSRGNTSSPLSPTMNTWLGGLNFGGYKGTSYTTSASIRSFATQSWSAGSSSSDLRFYTTDVNSAMVEHMRIAEDGNIGIGSAVNAPAANLHIGGSFILADGTQGIGRVLTSNALGQATWQTMDIDDADADPTNEMQTITAGSGLTGGGNGTNVTLIANVSNGLSHSGGSIVLGGSLTSTSGITHDAYNFSHYLNSTGNFQVLSGPQSAFLVNGSDGSVVVNESGSNTFDFRVEGDTDTHLLFVDASADKIGINEDTPDAIMHITGYSDADLSHLRIEESGLNSGGRIRFSNSIETDNEWLIFGRADNTLSDNRFNIHHSVHGNILQITGEKRVGINMGGPSFALHLPNDPTDGYARAHTWSTYSDRRIKREIDELPYGLATILALKPASYRQLDSKFDEQGLQVDEESAGQQSIGFIAQELLEVVPEAVNVPHDPDSELYGVDYARLIPVLTKAIQEQQEMIEGLQREVDLLKSRSENQQASK